MSGVESVCLRAFAPFAIGILRRGGESNREGLDPFQFILDGGMAAGEGEA